MDELDTEPPPQHPTDVSDVDIDTRTLWEVPGPSGPTASAGSLYAWLAGEAGIIKSHLGYAGTRAPQLRSAHPRPRHWGIFVDPCRAANAKGDLVPDAYHAALAIEHACDWVTTDRDFALFPGLRWHHPLG